MNFDELKSRDVKDLRKLAAQYGIPTGPRSKAETIAKSIVEFVMNQPKLDQLKHPAEQPAPQVANLNTEEDVRKVIAKYLEKPGFTASFGDDNTLWFKCRGAEECGHMSVPLRVIKSKAESLSRGAIAPRGFYDSKINHTPNSGTVLMV